MAKGVFTIEFDNVVDLLQQLRLLTIGAALPDIEAPVGVTRTTDDTPKATGDAQIGKPEPLYPTAEPDEPEQAPETPRGVLGKLGDGMTYRPAAETVTCSPQATTVVAPQDPAKDRASAAVPQQAPEHSERLKAEMTLENLSGVPYETLLAFCEQNPGVGINVKMCQPPYFRKTVEHRIKAFLTTPAS